MSAAHKSWKRPESVPFPNTWSSFERRAKDGRQLRFQIRDVATPEEAEECVDFMARGFLGDEKLSVVFDILNDPVSVEEQKRLWRELLDDRLALVCFVGGVGEERKIAGVNFNHYHHISDEDVDLQLKGAKITKLIDAVLYVEDKIDQYERLNITEYLNAYGLSVHPDYRGLGVATELLKAREPLGRAVGLDTTITMFSSLPSQRAAEKVGFASLVEVAYEELEGAFPGFDFGGGGDAAPTIKYMYRRLA